MAMSEDELSKTDAEAKLQAVLSAQFVEMGDLETRVATDAEVIVPPLTEGIHYDLPHERYHGDPCPAPALSASLAKLVNVSPLKAWSAHPRLGGAPEEGEEPDGDDTEAKDGGSVIDSLIFGYGPDIVEVAAKDWRTKLAKEARDQARAEGKIPVLADKLAKYLTAAEAIRANLTAALAENGIAGGFSGRSQATLIWRKENGVWCKARLDHLILSFASEGAGGSSYLILDLKTSYDASPAGAERSMNTFGAPLQRAAYVDGIETLHPEFAGRGDFLFLYAEKKPPFDCTVNRCNGELRELGERQWKRAVKKWGECLTSGKFPGYSKRVFDVAPRTYLIQADEEQQFAEHRLDTDKTVPF
jgi:hypothetical protein